MGILSKLRRQAAPDLALAWDTIPVGRLGDTPDLVQDLLTKRRDGVTVAGVLTPGEAARAVEGLDRIPEDRRLARPFGWLLGMPIGMLGLDDDRTPYLDDTERVHPMYLEAFGFDPHERIAQALAPCSGGRPCVAATEGGRPYNAGQVRWWLPDHGGLPAHVGNEFRAQLEDGAMAHLLTTTTVFDHLSYFLVLQRASEGGELSVYDLTFSDHPGRDDWGSEFPDDTWIESVPALRVDPEPGDLILFGGGWRWHRVDPPSGTTPRITYGGFAAPSLDDRAIHFWS